MKKRLWFILIMPYLLFAIFMGYYFVELKSLDNARVVIIDKNNMILTVHDYKGKKIFETNVATGKSPGQKQTEGDNKTPEGIFHLGRIENSESWEHDFKDGKGKIRGAYGPYFVNIEAPGHKGIGIHGTHDPKSIGMRVSEGCIRLNSEKLINFVSLVRQGDLLIISPGIIDLKTPVLKHVTK